MSDYVMPEVRRAVIRRTIELLEQDENGRAIAGFYKALGAAQGEEDTFIGLYDGLTSIVRAFAGAKAEVTLGEPPQSPPPKAELPKWEPSPQQKEAMDKAERMHNEMHEFMRRSCEATERIATRLEAVRALAGPACRQHPEYPSGSAIGGLDEQR